jgi:hypothetical protein
MLIELSWEYLSYGEISAVVFLVSILETNVLKIDWFPCCIHMARPRKITAILKTAASRSHSRDGRLKDPQDDGRLKIAVF